MPLTLYSLKEARKEIRRYIQHRYNIKGLKKALSERRLPCKWMGSNPVVADDDIEYFVTEKSRYRITKEQYWKIRKESIISPP
jgi:hypothetical protein